MTSSENVTRGKEKMEERQPIHARLDLYPGDPAYDKYVQIKEETGLLSHSEFLRFMVTQFQLKRKGASG